MRIPRCAEPCRPSAVSIGVGHRESLPYVADASCCRRRPCHDGCSRAGGLRFEQAGLLDISGRGCSRRKRPECRRDRPRPDPGRKLYARARNRYPGLQHRTDSGPEGASDRRAVPIRQGAGGRTGLFGIDPAGVPERQRPDSPAAGAASPGGDRVRAVHAFPRDPVSRPNHRHQQPVGIHQLPQHARREQPRVQGRRARLSNTGAEGCWVEQVPRPSEG